MLDDYVYWGRIDPLHIGFAFANSRALANEAIRRHDCDPVAGHILTRALNASLLLIPRLANEDRLNLHWTYPGACRNVLVDARGDGRIRGLINPPHLADRVEDDADIYGECGRLNLVTSRGERILNSGTSECPMRNVVRDLGYALSVSEQAESELNVMVDFTHDPDQPVALCQGILLQALPDCDLAVFERIRNRIHQPSARARLAHPGEADGQFEDVLNALIGPEEVSTRLEVRQGPSPEWFCTCNEEKFHTTLRMLPEEDRREILAEKEPIEIRCNFCNRAFRFSVEDARTIWAGSFVDS